MAEAKLVHIVARPYDAEVMRRALVEAGYPAVLVGWGSSGCVQVERERPAVVVLSTRRAEDECALFLRGLRAGEHGRSVPVVVVVEPGSRLATTQLGADRLLLRPLDVGALAAAVRALSGGSERAVSVPAVSSPAASSLAASSPPLVLSGVSSLEPPIRETRATGPSLPAVVAPVLQILRSGTLREIDPARLVAEAHHAGVTGRLRFHRGEAEKTIAFDGGDPVFASSNQSYDRLGDLLFREGKITREQYALCDEGVAGSGRRLGAILIDRGFIKARELFPLVRRQIAEIIYSLFAWTDGSYELTGGEPPPDEKIRLDLSTFVLVLEGIRRKYGLDRLQELVGPSETCLLALPAVSGLAADAPLVPAERASLELMDGRRSLREIASRTRTDELTLYQLAHAAMITGAVTRRGDAEVRVIHGEESVPVARQRELTIDRHRIEAKYAQVLEADYFTLLGVAPDASSHEALRAYQRASEEFRLEAFGAELRQELAAELDEIAETLEEAFEVISDEELRRSYRRCIGS